MRSYVFVAGALGLEPRQTVLETVVLTIDTTPPSPCHEDTTDYL